MTDAGSKEHLVTAADKLRELLASRPAQPNIEELVRWWRTSAELVSQLLDERRELLRAAEYAENLLASPAPDGFEAHDRIRHAAQGGHRRITELRAELDDARAQLRREQDARAELRLELDRERTQHRSNIEGFESALAREAHEKSILEQEVRELEQQRGAARAAARALVAQLDNLGSFVDDNDPRVMATAGPLGAAQADLWLALGLSLDDERARMQADIESRCAVCGWQMADPVKGTAGFMCRPGDCSQRPRPEKLYAPERAKREAEELHERAVLAGMPPSGRWA